MASMHTETTDIMAGLQPPIQSAIIWTRTAIIADENVIAVEYRPIMEPILLEKQLRMKAGMVAFKQPVPTPMRAVPVKRPKTPRLERSTTPMATRQRYEGRRIENDTIEMSLPAIGAQKANSRRGSVVRNPAEEAEIPRDCRISGTSGPTVPIGARMENDIRIMEAMANHILFLCEFCTYPILAVYYRDFIRRWQHEQLLSHHHYTVCIMDHFVQH